MEQKGIYVQYIGGTLRESFVQNRVYFAEKTQNENELRISMGDYWRYCYPADKLFEIIKIENKEFNHRKCIYMLNCDICGVPYESENAFPKPQTCDKCKNPPKKGETMTKEDFDDAVRICNLYKKLYCSGKGFCAAGDYIQLTFKSFTNYFTEYEIIDRGVGSYGWQLQTTYDGIKVLALADYNDMIKCEKTKQYLKEKM